MQVELLTRVAVDKEDAVLCKAEGCNRRVYADIHVLRIDGQVTVFGATCFHKIFGELPLEVKYPWTTDKKLTKEEKQLLEDNTVAFIERYLLIKPIATYQVDPNPDQPKSNIKMILDYDYDDEGDVYEHPPKPNFPFWTPAQGATEKSNITTPLTKYELENIQIHYLNKAQAELRRRAGLDPELAGWSGLVKLIALDMQTGVEVDWSWLAVDLSQPKSKQKKTDKPASSEVADQALNNIFDMLK